MQSNTNPIASRDERILETYSNLMEEIKRRLKIIESVLNGQFSVDERTGEELCILHLRMICELIAIGCLVVHADIKETHGGKISGLYQADLIIKVLGRLHQDFYPRPGKQFVHPDGSMEIINVDTGFLTRPELISLYGQCGDVLHIGSLKRWPTNWNRAIDLASIQEWGNKIVALLNHHMITLVRSDYEIWTLMQSGTDGKVRAYLFRKSRSHS